MSEVRTKLKKRAIRMVARLRVRIDGGPDAGRTCESEDATLTIGTSPDNSIVLNDPTVSRYHLELRRTESGVMVNDLGSRNGTYLSGSGIALVRASLPPGTTLQLGGTTLSIEDAGAIVAPAGDQLPDIPGLVGESAAMDEIRGLIQRLARVGSSVLIRGETGVGKEVVANALHQVGPRRDAPFVVVDCGSMPATLIASQLFGHERGAFTGADQQRPGAFERAQGGTVLLDEIGELPLEVQSSLLGVLERRRFVRVGGSEEINVDVRVLAATHRDLRAEVNDGAFRADLYYRLAVAQIVIPALRDRPEDIDALVAHFAEIITGEPGNPLRDAMADLRRHRWSGNARELRNVVESAIVMGRVDLDSRTLTDAPDDEPIVPYRNARADVLSRFEESYLEALITRCEGNASEAARRAKMDRPYLLTLLRKHGLRR